MAVHIRYQLCRIPVNKVVELTLVDDATYGWLQSADGGVTWQSCAEADPLTEKPDLYVTADDAKAAADAYVEHERAQRDALLTAYDAALAEVVAEKTAHIAALKAEISARFDALESTITSSKTALS